MRTGARAALSAMALLALMLAACGEGEQQQQQQQQGTVRTDRLPPPLRAGIRTEMMQKINPAFMRMWMMAQQGQTQGMDVLAGRMQASATKITSDMRLARTMPRDVQRDMLALYARLGEQASQLAEKGRTGDHAGALELLQTTRRETCNGCHGGTSTGQSSDSLPAVKWVVGSGASGLHSPSCCL